MPLWTYEAEETEQSLFTPLEEKYSRPVPFGIRHMDLAFPRGIKPNSPQIYAIQGPGGGRKTTFLINILINQLISGVLPDDHIIGIDTLESGMTVERYILIMKCIVATKIMLYEHYTGPVTNGNYWELFNRELPGKPPTVPPGKMIRDVLFQKKSGQVTQECCLSPDFVESAYYGQPGYEFSPRQIDSWVRAGMIVSKFRLVVFGVSEHPDPSLREKRYTNTTNIENSYRRWMEWNSKGMGQIVIDYLQEYFTEESYDHYYKQRKVIPFVSEFIKHTSSIAWVLSQDGISHQRMAMASDGQVLGSSGGDVLKNASQTNLRVNYYSNHKNPYWMICYSPIKGRRGNFPNLALMIEPHSGAIFGPSYEYNEPAIRSQVEGLI